MEFKKYALYLIVLIGAASCVSKKKIVYLQGEAGSGNASISNYEPTIQPDDLLYITVTSQNPEAAAPFNPQTSSQTVLNNGLTERAYLVSKDGTIQYPVIGTVKAGGLTRSEFTDMLKNLVKPYVSDAVVNLRFMNFKVTVLGEVGRPGRVSVESDRISLIDALAESGDMTIYGQRKNILIVRDNNGEKSFNRVDITRADFVNSPYYYLKQNDVVYVEPRRAKIDSTAIGGNVSMVMSIIGFLLTTTILILRL